MSKKNSDFTSADVALKIAKNKCAQLKDKISNLNNEIVAHRKPAEELNADICSYLGRNELTFEIQDNGYQIKRKGDAPAKNVSEGEKTAIAFLYFLKSLEDHAFTLSNGIVVIDDPVSSLDSNSLFNAFGFMKEKTKNAGQLFILTHNHSFFSQVKNWFKHCKKKANFYMLTSHVHNEERSSSISKLDGLLHEYESEYHYLFSLIYKAANTEGENSFQKNYYLPNVARRLLESFLSFRHPSLKSGDIREALDLSDFDGAKKTRILRFINTHSHAGQISDSEHDLSILCETKQVLTDLLNLIKKNDSGHYKGMITSIRLRG